MAFLSCVMRYSADGTSSSQPSFLVAQAGSQDNVAHAWTKRLFLIFFCFARLAQPDPQGKDSTVGALRMSNGVFEDGVDHPSGLASYLWSGLRVVRCLISLNGCPSWSSR